MGVLGAIAALAGTPALAAAQAPADTTPPTITVTAPTEGAQYTQGQPVQVSFACNDNVAVATCVGSTANLGMLDTSTVGPGTFTVNATDTSANPATSTIHYTVVAAGTGPINGGAPATMTLTLGTPGMFDPFIPGIGKSYTMAMTARIVSSAGDGMLTVADPSATASGHLLNGTYTMPQALKAAATSPTGTSLGATDVPSTAAPATLETWAGPANEDIALTFTQPVAQTDVLRTGSYLKTLVFTLSTTQP